MILAIKTVFQGPRLTYSRYNSAVSDIIIGNWVFYLWFCPLSVAVFVASVEKMFEPRKRRIFQYLNLFLHFLSRRVISKIEILIMYIASSRTFSTFLCHRYINLMELKNEICMHQLVLVGCNYIVVGRAPRNHAIGLQTSVTFLRCVPSGFLLSIISI